MSLNSSLMDDKTVSHGKIADTHLLQCKYAGLASGGFSGYQRLEATCASMQCGNTRWPEAERTRPKPHTCCNHVSAAWKRGWKDWEPPCVWQTLAMSENTQQREMNSDKGRSFHRETEKSEENPRCRTRGVLGSRLKEVQLERSLSDASPAPPK